MESLQTIQELKIPTNKLFYNKKTEVLSVYIMDLVFIGNYKKNTSLSKILDDIYESFGQTSLKRENLAIVEFVSLTPLAEKTKIDKLALISKKEAEKPDKSKKDALGGMRDEISSEIVREKKKSEAPAKSAKRKAKKVAYDEEPMEYEEEELYSETDEKFKEIADFDDDFEETEGEMERVKSMDYMPPLAPRSAPPAPGGPPPKAPPGAGAPSPKPAAEPTLSSIPEPDFFKKEVKGEEVKPSVYEINMGLQYYSVMMEKTSYLFYIYLSHKELKIMDEEGKTIFETSFIIKTTKKEPPVLNIKVEGEGFEVHPLFGRVEVKKDAINPPVMIFSVLPIKKKEKRTKKERKESERRHLHVYVEFEEKPINHSILSIIVQPKTFHVDIGPLHLDVSKKTAMIVSFISIIIAVASLMYTLFSIDPSSTTVDVVTNFAPGLGSIIFIGLFLYTLFKEGVRPLKEKISYFLNFDKAGMIVK